MKNKTLLFKQVLLLLCLSFSTLYGGPGGGPVKLEIIKSASPQYIEGNRIIHYTLTIRNTSQSVTYNDVTVIDNMVNGLFNDGNVTLLDQDENLSQFDCNFNASRDAGEMECNGSIGPDRVTFISYDVIAPNEPGTLENTASVWYDESEIDTASITVTIFPSYDGDLDYERDLCYVQPLPAEGNNCEQSGSFFYGPECTSEIEIRRNDNVTWRALQNVHVLKAYTSPFLSDDCYTSDGINILTPCDDSNKSIDDLLHRDSSLYLQDAFSEAHNFSLGDDIAFDSNISINLVDINSTPVSGNGNNQVTDFEYIALIGVYNVSGSDLTIEEYIYPCDGGYGVPPQITQETTGGVNDVNLHNPDVSQENVDYIDYNTYNKIGTKIVNQPFLLGITYLNAEGNPADYLGTFTANGNNEKEVSAAIILRYRNDSGNIVNPPLWSGEMAPDDDDEPDHILTLQNFSNDEETQGPYPIIREAARNGQIEIQLIDYASFFRALDGLNCNSSSLDSSLCLVPACLNSANQILEVFPIENYPYVAKCIYGDGNGAAPCDSNAYEGNCGGKKITISPSDYDNDYGCAQCLADAVAPNIYANEFAVRPYSYSLKVKDILDQAPNNNRFEAGQTYQIELNATTADPSDTQANNYNQVINGNHDPISIAEIILEVNSSLSCPDIEGQDQEIRFDQIPGVDGPGGYSASDINYTNVGETILKIMDQDWTIVDQNTTNPASSECILDSNETDPTKDELHHGRVGCMLYVEQNLTFVPHHFALDVNLSDQGDNFTYLHDFNFTTGVPKMGADLNISIKAENKAGNVTSNYIDQCYAKENNVTLEFASNPDDNMTIDPGNSLTHFLYYNVKDGNRSSIPLTDKVGITSLPEPLVGSSTIFEPNAPDGNGTATLQYIINFNRFQHLLVNPIHMKLSDVNLTDIDGVPSADPTFLSDNATFQYAKAIPLKDFYPNVRTSVASTPILVHVYCTYGDSTCYNIYNIDTIEGTTPSGDWWISTRHDSARDGNITMKIDLPSGITEGAGTPSLGYPTAKIIADGIDKKMTVNRGTAPTLPMTVEIELDDAGVIELSPWLIYNVASQFNIPNPFFKVRFIEPANWTGVGATGHTVDTDSDINEKKRMDW